MVIMKPRVILKFFLNLCSTGVCVCIFVFVLRQDVKDAMYKSIDINTDVDTDLDAVFDSPYFQTS